VALGLAGTLLSAVEEIFQGDRPVMAATLLMLGFMVDLVSGQVHRPDPLASNHMPVHGVCAFFHFIALQHESLLA